MGTNVTFQQCHPKCLGIEKVDIWEVQSVFLVVLKSLGENNQGIVVLRWETVAAI